MEKREPSCTAGGNVNWCSHCGKQLGGFSKKLKTELPHDPAIPLSGTSEKNENTSLIAALLTIAKIWKQPKCPLTDE